MSERFASCSGEGVRVPADALVKQYKPYFYWGLLFGCLFFMLYRSNISDDNLRKFSLLIDIISNIDYFVLPRSLQELDPILIHVGFRAYLCAALMFFACFLLSSCIMFRICWRWIGDEAVVDVSRPKQIISALIASILFFYRPADFERGSYVINYIDRAGFWIVRESLVIVIVYAQVCVIIVNIVTLMLKLKTSLARVDP